ncbi:cell division protein FtsQ/DivIB [Arthrobacter sp. PAMC 25486]|uniref:cell division protein FtsQ/DivIB n=1 Tax=Arthrobacter sp. PAMC 25486 TaxID=1494608 RepID=UPI0009DF1EE4|nr:cell division protein FtsQ/DivIB [Arthrobacter sp. PAMC 25486]
MAEPRKPRVIKTRPRATPPEGGAAAATAPAEDKALATAKPPAAKSTPVTPAAEAAAKPAAGAVRHTSSKVSVEPLPSDKAADSTPAPAKRASPKAARSGLPSLKTGSPMRPKPRKPKAAASMPPRTGPSNAADGQDAPHAQVLAFPVPRFKRRRRTIVYSVAGIVAVLALVMSFALFSPVLAVKTVVFDGQKLVDPKILEHAVAPIFGKPLPQVTAEEVQALLGQVVQVKSSRIEARPPSTLHVRIVERIPVALLKNEDTYLLVDQEGVELGTTTDPASVSLPLIDGGKAVIGQDTFNAMTAVLANLPQSILAQLANASAASPDAVELKLVDGRSVIWGDASDMELKAVVLEALLNAPVPAPEAGAPAPAPVKVFDVSAPRRPVTR